MDTVVVSSNFQVRLPRRVREALGLTPGQLLQVIQHGRRVELVPLRPAFEAPGLFAESPSPDSQHLNDGDCSSVAQRGR